VQTNVLIKKESILKNKNKLCPYKKCGPGSSVGIATGYRQDGPGIESRLRARFFAHVQTGPGTHPASCTMGIGSFLGVKRPGHGADYPPPPSAEVESD
jgi:hypothetical protein